MVTTKAPGRLYQLFDSPDIMGIGFTEPPLLNYNPLQFKPGLIYPGARITHLGGKKTSAGFFILDFPEPLVYRGLYHAPEPDGLLALFTCGDKPAALCRDGYAEAYYCYHWLPEERAFIWSSARSRTARLVETDNAVWQNPPALAPAPPTTV